MSGGAFDYACWATDLQELIEKRRQWRELRDAFEAIEADDVAAEIDAMLAYLNLAERRIEVRLGRLRDVAKAMEWWHSCDWSRGQVDEEIARYRQGLRRDPEPPVQLAISAGGAGVDGLPAAADIHPRVRDEIRRLAYLLECAARGLAAAGPSHAPGAIQAFWDETSRVAIEMRRMIQS